MITIIYRNFPTIQMIFGKRFLYGHLFKFFRAFLFPIFEFSFEFHHDAKGQASPSTYPSWGSDISRSHGGRKSTPSTQDCIPVKVSRSLGGSSARKHQEMGNNS